jgi:hypothetical protein
VPLGGRRSTKLGNFGGIGEGIEVDVRKQEDRRGLCICNGGMRDGGEEQERKKTEEFQRETSNGDGEQCSAGLLLHNGCDATDSV